MPSRAEWEGVNPHGSIGRYRGTRKITGCRCAECRRANRDYHRARRNIPPDQPPPEFKPAPGDDGSCPMAEAEECSIATRSQYVRGCRGDACTEENRLYQRDYMRWFHHGIRRGEWPN